MEELTKKEKVCALLIALFLVLAIVAGLFSLTAAILMVCVNFIGASFGIHITFLGSVAILVILSIITAPFRVESTRISIERLKEKLKKKSENNK